MLRIAIFEFVQIVVSAFAIRNGGPPERIVGWLLLIAAFVSLGIGAPHDHFATLYVLTMWIDLCLLAGLFVVAMRANRFWPQWAVALQLIACGVHGVRAYDPYFLPVVYARLTGQMAYVICLALVLGTYHYLRRARREGRPPAAWAPLRW